MRELIEQPPAEAFLAGYFDYTPSISSADPEDDAGEVTFDVADCEV